MDNNDDAVDTAVSVDAEHNRRRELRLSFALLTTLRVAHAYDVRGTADET